jgi:hypothetical protein
MYQNGTAKLLDSILQRTSGIHTPVRNSVKLPTQEMT